jgi:hypothetical protein
LNTIIIRSVRYGHCYYISVFNLILLFLDISVKIFFFLSENERILVLEEKFDLTKLVTYRVGGTLSGMVFPINTVLLAIGEEMFSSSRQNPNLPSGGTEKDKEKENSYLTMSKENTRHEHMTNLTQLHQFQEDFQTTSHQMGKQREFFQEKWSATPSLQEKTKQSKAQLKRLYVQQLQKYLAEVTAAKERAKQEESTYFQGVQHSFDSCSSYEKLIQEQQQLIEDRKKEIKEKNELLLKLKFCLEAKQIKLLYELHDLFPIEIRKGNECFIRDIEIPNDLVNTVKDDDMVASGLGYVVHLLLLCSKYLEVGSDLNSM